MFCTSCGATIPDNSAFCTYCGAKADVTPQAPVYEQPVQPQAPVYEQPVQPQAPYGQPMVAKPAKKKGVIALVAGIIVAIIVVVVLLIVFVFSGGSKNKSTEDPIDKIEKEDSKNQRMEDPIDKVMKAVNEQKLSYLYESMPSFMAKELKSEINDEYEKEKDFWADEFGIGDMFSSVTVSYEIADKEKLDKDEIDDLEEEIEYDYDKKVSISSAYVLEVDVEATLKFNTKSLKEEYGDDYAELLEYYYGKDWKKGIEESETLEAVVIKINDEWFLYDPEAFF